MKLKNQGGTNASDSSNCFVYIYLHTVILIANPVILNKQERFLTMQSLCWSRESEMCDVVLWIEICDFSVAKI